MVDTLTPIQRKRAMANVMHTNTKPERLVCSILHRMGYRFRKNVSSLPSNPDIVLSKYKTAIFVHGCFWHQHDGCKRACRPKSNVKFWNNKFDKTIKRDQESIRKLRSLGWNTIAIWECEIADREQLIGMLSKLLPRQLKGLGNPL